MGGAHLFVDAVKHAAVAIGSPKGLISLVLASLATELPEKFNSIFWVKDRQVIPLAPREVHRPWSSKARYP